MSELRLAIVECRYPDIVQDELLKDQFIFGLAIKEVQDHLLGEIKAQDPSEKCLLESRKIESKIKQRKLLGIKTARTYNSIQNHRGRGKFRSKNQSRGRSASTIKNCKYCGKLHDKGTAQLLAKDAKSVAKIIILRQFAKVVQTAKEIIVDKDPKIKERVGNFMKSMNKMKRSWMTWLNRCNHYFTMMCTSMQ